MCKWKFKLLLGEHRLATSFSASTHQHPAGSPGTVCAGLLSGIMEACDAAIVKYFGVNLFLEKHLAAVKKEKKLAQSHIILNFQIIFLSK